MNQGAAHEIVHLVVWLVVLRSDLSRSRKPASSEARSLALRDGWALQSSGKVDEKGEILSSPSFQPKGWYHGQRPDHGRRGAGQAQGVLPIRFSG